MTFECSECHSKDLVCDETRNMEQDDQFPHLEAKIACRNCLHYDWV